MNKTHAKMKFHQILFDTLKKNKNIFKSLNKIEDYFCKLSELAIIENFIRLSHF